MECEAWNMSYRLKRMQVDIQNGLTRPFFGRGKSGWWTGCRHICNEVGLKDLVNLICLGDVSVNVVDKLETSVNEKKMEEVCR